MPLTQGAVIDAEPVRQSSRLPRIMARQAPPRILSYGPIVCPDPAPINSSSATVVPCPGLAQLADLCDLNPEWIPQQPTPRLSAPAPILAIPAVVTPRRPPQVLVADFIRPRPDSRAVWNGAELSGFQKSGRSSSKIWIIPLLFICSIGIAFWIKSSTSRPASSDITPQAEAMGSRWQAFQKGLASRAGFAFFEDFRSGLHNWVSQRHRETFWSLDQTGFIQPTYLAVFRPSLEMTDYEVEFLGQIDRKALSWVFRAQDTRNYYVGKLVLIQPGPLPKIALRHYAVLNGRETGHEDIPLPFTIAGNPTFRVHLAARGSDFAVNVQDRLAGFWVDSRIASGGFGFFSGRGESSRICWVRMQHQYDVLGRICAYLSPLTISTNRTRSNGSWK